MRELWDGDGLRIMTFSASDDLQLFDTQNEDKRKTNKRVTLTNRTNTSTERKQQSFFISYIPFQ